MTKQQRLAAILLNLYWTGAGDAGTDRTIFSFHNSIPLSDKEVEKALEDGKSTTVEHEGKRITQTEYFLLLAEKTINSIEN